MSNQVFSFSTDAEELDEAFTKINMYLFSCNNNKVRELLYNNLQVLAKEVIKKDKSLSMKLTQYLITVKLAMKRNKK